VTEKKKKKVIVTSKSKKQVEKTKPKLKPTQRKRKKTTKSVASSELVFNRENYKWILIGVALIIIGFVLMSGGSMPSPDVWEDDRIYSFRRVTLAPIVILIGLGVEVYAIFR